MSTAENARRRSTARAMWTQQLTPEQVAAQPAAPESDSPPLSWAHEMRESLQRAMDYRS